MTALQRGELEIRLILRKKERKHEVDFDLQLTVFHVYAKLFSFIKPISHIQWRSQDFPKGGGYGSYLSVSYLFRTLRWLWAPGVRKHRPAPGHLLLASLSTGVPAPSGLRSVRLCRRSDGDRGNHIPGTWPSSTDPKQVFGIGRKMSLGHRAGKQLDFKN